MAAFGACRRPGTGASAATRRECRISADDAVQPMPEALRARIMVAVDRRLMQMLHPAIDPGQLSDTGCRPPSCEVLHCLSCEDP